ncbi:MAG: hypothetical protein L6W00_26100 [Lentisphaeria bacterium]|nr:MAG: hypothetical protein L6W00_26100 [Lentisphaeria bacterium]
MVHRFDQWKKVYSTERYGNQSKQFLPTDHIFNFPVKPGKNTFAITVRAGSDGCRLVCGAVPFVADPDAARRLFTVTESARYRPLPNDRYLVKKGTALDFSELNGKRVPAGTLGRVIVNSAGKLAFEKRPHVPVRFIAMNYLLWYWRLEAHRWTRGDIERFADAVAAQGLQSDPDPLPEPLSCRLQDSPAASPHDCGSRTAAVGGGDAD